MEELRGGGSKENKVQDKEEGDERGRIRRIRRMEGKRKRERKKKVVRKIM